MRKNRLKKSVAVTLAAVTIAWAVPSNIALASGFNHNNFETALQGKIEFLQSIKHYECLKFTNMFLYYLMGGGEMPDSDLLQRRANHYILNNPDFNIIWGLSNLHNLISVIPDHSVNVDIRDELEYIIYRASLLYTNTNIINIPELIGLLEGLDDDLINPGLEARKAVRGHIERAFELSQKADLFRDPFDNTVHILDNAFDLIFSIVAYIDTYSQDYYGNVIFDVSSSSLNMLLYNEYKDYTMAISNYLALNAIRNVLVDLDNVGRSQVYVELMYSNPWAVHTINGTDNLISRVDTMLHSLDYIITSIYYVEKAALELLGIIPTLANVYTIEFPYFAHYSGFYRDWAYFVALQGRSDLIWGRLEILEFATLYLEFVIDYGLSSDEAFYKLLFNLG